MAVDTRPERSSSLKNIGPVSRGWLTAIGIHNQADLAAMGAVAAYCLIKAQGYPASLNLLYALDGALTDTRWDALTPERKQALREETAAFRFVSPVDGTNHP